MERLFANHRGVLIGLLFALLVGAQTISAAHAYEHDPGSVGDTTCATCVSGTQLAAAAVDSGQPVALPVARPALCSGQATMQVILARSQARQRGPPAIP